MADTPNDGSTTAATASSAPVSPTSDPGGRQPEALATFAAAARADGEKPDDVGLTATPETDALPADPKAKDDAATRVLREGVLGRDQGADEAVRSLPDRTRTDV